VPEEGVDRADFRNTLQGLVITQLTLLALLALLAQLTQLTLLTLIILRNLSATHPTNLV
jgi:hypothetical protein